MEEERLDKIILERGLVSSRTRCERIIKDFGVLVNGKLEKKPGKKVNIHAEIKLLSEEIPWVSRGALKLDAARVNWEIDFHNKIVLDVGASTGGFTEVALANGAKKVYCVDVGVGQLHSSLVNNPSIVNIEKTHIRELTRHQVDEKIDLIVVDVSFISLEKIFPFCVSFLKEGGQLVALIKPQFEVGKENVGKGGIVKKKDLYPEVLQKITRIGKENQLNRVGWMDSPILGGDGNQEFLMFFKKEE